MRHFIIENGLLCTETAAAYCAFISPPSGTSAGIWAAVNTFTVIGVTLRTYHRQPPNRFRWGVENNVSGEVK